MATHIIMVWYDTNKTEDCIYEKYNDYTFEFYNDKKQCIDYISSMNKNETIFLILSISCALEILPNIHELRQINYIYLFK
jgi:hypothetical protein